MSARFLCVLTPDGASILDRPPLSAPNLAMGEWRWRRVDMNGLAALVDDDGAAGHADACAVRGVCVAGLARLDDREAVERWAGIPHARLRVMSDLELIAHAVAERGTSCLARLAGDFGFVVWHAWSRTAVAVRDPIGVRPLYHAAWGDRIALSSHASLLTTSGCIDLEYIAGFLAGGFGPSDRSVYSDVRPVEPGTLVTFRVGEDGAPVATRYWSALELGCEAPLRGDDVAEEFRELFFRGVRQAVGDGAGVWSQLSGGVDSSSVVSAAQWLAGEEKSAAGLRGTVTYVDTLGDGDEREFSDLVVRRWGVRNEVLQDYWAWQDDGSGLPQSDEPRLMFPFWARDRRMGGVVREGGGRVMLSGMGPDHYLAGNPLFLADWLAAGRVADVVREAARWAIKGRVSFWTFALENALLPFLSPKLQLLLSPARNRLPPWIAKEFVRRFDLERRFSAIRVRSGPTRSKFAGDVAVQLDSLSSFLDRGQFGGGFEVRYPYLYRPLLELGLRLPASLRAQPYARKAVLREAMRGVLPEGVRTRSGKGGIDARIVWSLSRERERLGEILRDPVLAQLGCIESAALRTAVNATREGRFAGTASLIGVMSLETWLRVRHGLWRPETRINPRASTLAAAPV